MNKFLFPTLASLLFLCACANNSVPPISSPTDTTIQLVSEPIPRCLIDSPKGCEVAETEPATPPHGWVIHSVEVSPVDSTTIPITETAPPEPVNEVIMPSCMGNHWHRVPPEKLWVLRSVTFDLENHFPTTIYLDKIVVEVANQIEEISVDISLEPGEYRIVTATTTSINGIESGRYPLHVNLQINGRTLCEREDIAVVFWPEDN